MKLIADLHIHSRFSRATSKDLDLKNLEKYALLKGVNLLGTGDFTHPEWIKEIKANLKEDGSGFLKSATGFNFILQTEISLIYSQGGKGRRVHVIVLAPDISTVEQINESLLKLGRLDYDGRPIFGMSCPAFVERMRSISKDIEIIPAHIFTPWFSMFGSNSGFNSVKECFIDQTSRIRAVETGLSSDPKMNWRLSQLDNFTLVSFSDLHSFWPWRMGREATIFDIKPTYYHLIAAIKNNLVMETIEVDPNYGKYHFDGHRNCNVSLSPYEARQKNNICPKCGKQLTIGVLHRVEELADRAEGYTPKERPGFKSLLPLSDIISAVEGSPVASKNTWRVYYNLIKEFKSEFNILLDAEKPQLEKTAGKELAEAILKNREGRIEVKPGYDGEYGIPMLQGKKKEVKEVKEAKAKPKPKQKSLSEF